MDIGELYRVGDVGWVMGVEVVWICLCRVFNLMLISFLILMVLDLFLLDVMMDLLWKIFLFRCFV